MAEMTFKVSLEEFGKKAAEYALDEITYNDLTIRQWVEKITSGEFQPVRHGRWIEDNTDLICSVCKWKYSDELPFMSNHGLDSMTEAFAHCPHCGAKLYADGGTISKERSAEIMRGADNV